jgi:hypothetical protein
MEIINEMKEIKKQFNELNVALEKKNKERKEIEDELLRLQGEYRYLVRMGMKEGIIDEQGNLIKAEEKEEI